FYGTRMPQDLVRRLHGLGYRVAALTDRNNLYGVHEFLEACREQGLRPILGATLQQGPQEVAVLVKNRQGFSNLCSLLTQRKLKEETFRLAEEIPRYASGNAILCRDPPLLSLWKSQVEDLSVWLSGLDRSLYRLARNMELPSVAAPEILCFEPEDREVHQVLQAIQRREALGEIGAGPRGAGAREFGGGWKEALPAKEMATRFSIFPQVIEATQALAERCTFQEIFQGFVFPRLPHTVCLAQPGSPSPLRSEHKALSPLGNTTAALPAEQGTAPVPSVPTLAPLAEHEAMHSFFNSPFNPPLVPLPDHGSAPARFKPTPVPLAASGEACFATRQGALRDPDGARVAELGASAFATYSGHRGKPEQTPYSESRASPFATYLARGCDPQGASSSEHLAELRQKVLRGAEERYGEVAEGVLARIEYELSIIAQKGFAEYFLVVADIVRRSSRTCGRGSAAASVVAYCLGITNVDPIRHNLYFERFLNLDRSDPPDIDVDFAWDERDGIIEEVFREYGMDHCARVCNHVFYRFPSALRDTARVFGIPEGEITAFEKTLFRGRWASEEFQREGGQAAASDVEGEKPVGIGRYEGNLSRRSLSQRSPGGTLPVLSSPWNEIVRIAERITGLPRHLSVHSGGVIITPQPLDTYVPIEIADKGVRIVTWEKEGVESAGLVKIDLLGNRSLAVIRDALENLKENGIEVGKGFNDPTTDPATQALLARGDTMGVFYVESPAMRQLQMKTGKGDFEHLVIHSSIIRPAANRFINLYVRRLRGEPYEPLHPDLDRILSETYGILCYQEDVSKAAVVLSGFSNADADGLRKILSKKNKEAYLSRYREQFYKGALNRGVPRPTIDRVWEMILSFEGYSFCKAHSASYAMVSFQSAYLKAHHPAEFMAAVLSNRGGYYTPAAYISEARRMGLTLLGPDVNHSFYTYRGKGREIRVGFVEVEGLHRETVEAILAERKRRSFSSLEDFATRVNVQGEDAEALVSVGAFDSIAPDLSPSKQLWALLKASHRRAQAKESSLFGATFSLSESKQDARERRERWKGEFRRLGFLLDAHVLKLWEPIPSRYRQVRGKDLRRYVGQRVEMVGWPVTRKEIFTREGKPMEFVSFEDETEIYETILFPKAYEQFGHTLEEPRPYIIRGKVEEDLGAVSIHVEGLSPLISQRNLKER
ncbi:MAG: DNA polymerase III subunit alpha, partial [Spirochaetales bacterium]